MGIFARRGAKACAIAFAGALAFGASATAADIDGGPIDIDGDQAIDAGINAPNIWRFADSDRVGTALQATDRTNNVWGDTVIVASSQVFADALAATPLADLLDAPVLLSKPGATIEQRVVDYIDDDANGFTKVILVGGTDVFGATAKAQLGALNNVSNVDRAEGLNRYQTARELAVRTIAAASEIESDHSRYDEVNVFFASGQNFPDALAAGAAAAANDGILLLTKGADGIDKDTYDFVRYAKFGIFEHGSTIAVGGPAAAAVQNGWEGTPIEVNDSIVGSDRYETATLLAEDYVSGAENAVIASGQNFPDGVVGGAYAANVDGPLLLTREDNLTKVTREYLQEHRNDFNGVNDEVGNIFVFGGVNSISKNVTNQLANEVEWNY